MVARVSTIAFEGVETRPIDVQVQVASGNVAFMIVGLGDKAVAESRERVRAALIASRRGRTGRRTRRGGDGLVARRGRAHAPLRARLPPRAQVGENAGRSR